jgi:hypothetical protein
MTCKQLILQDTEMVKMCSKDFFDSLVCNVHSVLKTKGTVCPTPLAPNFLGTPFPCTTNRHLLFLLASPKLGGFYQLYEPEKDGPMEGSSIPPTPVYSSRFLMVDEDISFDTSVHWHLGHCGAGSLVDTRSTSKL